ncbi:MAG: hypothetical protein WBO04_08070 [Steroidobacteraceae bacterium]
MIELGLIEGALDNVSGTLWDARMTAEQAKRAGCILDLARQRLERIVERLEESDRLPTAAVA